MKPRLHQPQPPTLLEEGAITMAEAARLLPRRRGKKVHASTVVRWIKKGSRGVKLEGQLLPSGWITSAPAIERFTAAYQRAAVAEAVRVTPPPSARRRAEIEAAERRLDAAGIGAREKGV